MSVPTWKRDLSKADYLYQVYQLNVRIGEIVVNGPKKYRANYGDHLIQTCLLALQEGQLANSIYVSKNMVMEEFEMRRMALKRMMAYVHNIGTAFKLYKDLIKKCDGQDPIKLRNEYEEIAERCAYTTGLIKGLLDFDKRKLKGVK